MDFIQNKTTQYFIQLISRLKEEGLAKNDAEIADKIKFSRTTMSSIMNGRRNVPLEVYNNLQNAYKSDSGKLEGTGIPVYDAVATGGVAENISQLSGQPLFFMNIPGYEDCKMALYHYGHSMYPTIESGSLLLLKPIADKSIIMYGEMYLIRTSDYFMVKRLQKSDMKGFVLCTSDNFEKRTPDYRRFEPFDLPIDKIIDLYLVKGIIRKAQS